MKVQGVISFFNTLRCEFIEFRMNGQMEFIAFIFEPEKERRGRRVKTAIVKNLYFIEMNFWFVLQWVPFNNSYVNLGVNLSNFRCPSKE